jgi:hypothetical protein
MIKTLNSLPAQLVRVLEVEFDSEPLALTLFEDFLGSEARDPATIGRWIDVAAGRTTGYGWALRRAAALMLESCAVVHPPDDPAGVEFILTAIAAIPSSGLTIPPGPGIRTEGYTSTEFRGFARQVRARLGRHARIHERIRGRATSPEALRDFIAIARNESRLTLARYFFSPGEVAERAREQTRGSRGFPAPFDWEVVTEEAQLLLREYPEYERRVFQELCHGSRIFWVDESTESRIGSLVEYPLGTVVMVVKPPGSSLEFEIKRAGRKGDTPLSVVYERDGERICSTHRLDGGSMGSNLKAEAFGAAVLNRLFRLIHGCRAPISLTLSHRTVHEIPCGEGEADLLDYLTRPEVFGPGFESMRHAMARSIRSFGEEWDSEPLDAPGDYGLTAAFLAQANPAQAILAGTSSFRLDLLAAYLSHDGADRYFRSGLGVEFTADDSRRFAEEILEEVLGVFHPVAAGACDFGEFVEAVFGEPENRRRSDAIFLSLTQQIGLFWGTLFGLKAYSLGESFVGRNVGLRSVWDRGDWRVRLTFLDHDLLVVPRSGFRPDLALWGVFIDATYVVFTPPSGRRSELDLLASIYRISPATLELGRSSLLRAARSAYRRTRLQLETHREVRQMYEPDCLRDLLNHDDAIAGYARARSRGCQIEEAAQAAAEILRDAGHGEVPATSFAVTLKQYDKFLNFFSCLFDESDPFAEETAAPDPPFADPQMLQASLTDSIRRGFA